MYLIYLFILCHTTVLLTPVQSYVVLAANLKDFRRLAKSVVPNNVAYQIEKLFQQTDPKYKEEDENEERTVEYLEENQQQKDESFEVVKALKAALAKKIRGKRYQLENVPKISYVEPPSKSSIAQPVVPTILTLEDIVEKVKKRLLKNILVNTQAKAQDEQKQLVESLYYNNDKSKSFKSEIKDQLENPAPVKVLKEEVQFEDTYEDTDDKNLNPKIKYYGQSEQIPVTNKKFVNSQNYGPVKKVRYVKQVVLPVSSNKGPHTYVPQGNMAQQLASMQQQINQLNRIVQQTILNNKQRTHATESPELNIEAVEAEFQVIPNANATTDVQEPNDSQEEPVEVLKKEADENALSEETTIEPVTEPSTKALTIPGENEQFTEDNEVAEEIDGTADNADEGTKDTTPEEINDDFEEDNKNDPATLTETEGKENNNARLGSNTKVFTKEFGTPDANPPIVEKTYNFNEPVAQTDKVPELKLPAGSVRKVMLF